MENFLNFFKIPIDILSHIIYNITCVEELTRHQHKENKRICAFSSVGRAPDS